MKVIGVKSVRIAYMTLPGDFPARLKAPRVAMLAESQGLVGPLHEPWVRMPGYRVIAGRDRIAAAVVREQKTIACKLVECTDEEAELIEHHENVRRREDPEERRRREQRLLELMEAQELVKQPALTGKPGRPVTARGRARRRLAAMKGVQPESVRREDRPEPEEAAPEAPEPPIHTLGVELDQEWLNGIGATKAAMQEAYGRLNAAMKCLKPVVDAGWYPDSRIAALRQLVHEAMGAVREHYPESLCPYCKALPGVSEECVPCMGAGFIASHQMSTVPEELWAEGANAVVHYRGALVPVSKIESEPEE